MTGRGVPQLSVGSSEASLPGLSPTVTTTRVRLRPASVIEFRLRWCATGGGAPVAQSWASG